MCGVAVAPAAAGVIVAAALALRSTNANLPHTVITFCHVRRAKVPTPSVPTRPCPPKTSVPKLMGEP